MTLRLRHVATLLLVAVVLALPAPASAVAGSGCATADPTFCVSYGADVLSALSGQPTTQSLEPVNLRLSFSNDSASYRDQAGQGRWLGKLSATVLSNGTIRPVVTSSVNLSDGLLVGGDPDDSLCGPGTDSTFSGCAAGHGVAYAKVTSSSFLLPSGIYTATYGIKQIKNVKATTHLAQYRATLGVCIQYSTSKCYGGAQTQSQDLTADLPAPGEPMTFDFLLPTGVATPISGVTIDRFTVHTLRLALRGGANRLANGGSVGWQNVVRLPQTCGTVSAGATLTDVAGAVISLPQSFTVTGCTLLTGSVAMNQVGYGAGTTLSGRLTTTAGAAVANRKLVLNQCAVGQACKDVNATWTNGTGGYSFTVKPWANTTYTVADRASHRSVARTVKVAPTVALAFDKARMWSGAKLTLSGSVAPNHAGKYVVIQRSVDGAWKGVASVQLSSSSSYVRTITLAGTSGRRAYLRVVLAAHTDHAAGISATRSVLFN